MLKPKSVTFLLIGIALIVLGLWTFTRPAIWGSWDFSNTGQIGDTIGGISSPIINLVGAWLVYLSFREQYEANQLQREELKNEIAFKRHKHRKKGH